MKFCTKTQTGIVKKTENSKILKIQDGGRPLALD